MKRNIILFLVFSISIFILVWKVEAIDRKVFIYKGKSNVGRNFEGVAYNRITYKLSEVRFDYILMNLGFEPEWKYHLAYYLNRPFRSHGPSFKNEVTYRVNKKPDIVPLVEYDKNYSIWPRAWFGLPQDVAPTGISTTVQLFFYREASKLGLSIKPLNYPLELQTQPKEDLLGVWQEAEIMCTFCFPF